MSRGPGHIERAIRELFDASPDLAFVTVELVEHCFPGIAEADIERKHEVSVLRAAHKIVAADADWMAKRIEGQGSGWVFFNHANVQSYALFRMIADMNPFSWQYYRSPARARRAARAFDWSDDADPRLITREQLLARLAPGERQYNSIQPGGAWFRHVEQHAAKRDGDTARVEALERAHEEAMAVILSRLGKGIGAVHANGSETLSALGPVFAWFAEQVREVTTQNDPDEQRASLDHIARNLDVLQQAVTGPNPSAALRHIAEQMRVDEQQSEAAE